MPSTPLIRSRRRTTLGLAGRGVLMWALALGGLRAFVVQAEQCGDPTPDAVRASASAAVGWFARNQNADGTWLYRYDRDLDAPVGGYNITRHAGATMSLEQAAGVGIGEAGDVADRGIEWAVENLYQGPGWRALAAPETQSIGSGASGLLAAALVYRRERTGDGTYDGVLHDLGAFMTSLVNERGQVFGQWDTGTGAPVPDSFSKYYTGEVFWALTMLHRAFPGDGYGAVAERIAHYIAIERTEVENFEPDLPDHWAAYGFAVMTTWPGYELPDQYDYYVRRQAGIQGMQIRYESQRTNSFFSYITRGRQTLGAGLGTVGEALSQWSIVARATPRLGDIVTPLSDRARCAAGASIDRQVGDDDVAADDDRDAVLGAWFQFDITQMDDQQHSLSALLGALAIPQERS
jgi:hypothetical protein